MLQLTTSICGIQQVGEDEDFCGVGPVLSEGQVSFVAAENFRSPISGSAALSAFLGSQTVTGSARLSACRGVWGPAASIYPLCALNSTLGSTSWMPGIVTPGAFWDDR